MKIYILPVDSKFQPESQLFRYPPHNKDFGVEQDFHRYQTMRKDMLVETHDKADWHYLPIYWTRWHLNHHYGQSGLDELQNEINRSILNDSRTFTICQYDDGPVADLGKATIFLASRKNESGIDIPLLSSPHKKPLFRPSKKYLASFIGRLSTHPIRHNMAIQLKDRDDMYIYDGDKGNKFFVREMLKSFIALCPRGYGGSSFRFFEAMQLGVVPFLIGNIDTRPFKKSINWDEISFFSNSPCRLMETLRSLNMPDLILMGKKAEKIWKDKLSYQKWCPYALEALEKS